jgi:hypothetical protein
MDEGMCLAELKESPLREAEQRRLSSLRSSFWRDRFEEAARNIWNRVWSGGTSAIGGQTRFGGLHWQPTGGGDLDFSLRPAM